MDAFFAPVMKKTNAGTPRDTFEDITNAQRKASANAGATSTMHTCFAPSMKKTNEGTHRDTFGDITNAQRKASANAVTPICDLKLTDEHLSLDRFPIVFPTIGTQESIIQSV